MDLARLGTCTPKAGPLRRPAASTFLVGTRVGGRELSDNNAQRQTLKWDKPLGFSYPYTFDQFESFRAVFIACAKGGEAAAEALFETRWPQIKAEAQRCQESVDAQEIRRPDPNVWRGLNTAVKRGDVQRYFEKHPNDIDALLYGAMRAGIIARSEGDDYTEEYKALIALNRDELRVALEAAKAPESMLSTAGKRPRPADGYAGFLVEIYHEIRGTSPRHNRLDRRTREREGPGIRFFTAALAPFRLNLTSHGMHRLIKRASENVLKQSGAV